MWGIKHKYGATRSQCGTGHMHASRLEAAICDLMWLRARAGEIRSIEREVPIYLTLARIKYVADFLFIETKTDKKVYAEAKGAITPVWRLKRKLWEYYGPGPLEIWRGTYTKPELIERLEIKR